MITKNKHLSSPLRQLGSRHPDVTAVGLLLVVTLLLFFKYLHPQTSHVLSRPGDLSTQFVWWRQFGFGELREGNLALWNPHLFCGAPFFGGFQSALFYPLNWIFLFLPLAFALNLSMVLHVFLAGWFTYLWVRGRGNHPTSALLASFIYMFSGAFFVRIVVGHLSNLCAMAWIPLVFWALDGWIRERKGRWIAWGALALTLQFFSGHIQYCYYTALAVGFYSVAILYRIQRKVQFLSGLATIYTLGIMMAAVQLLTGWDAVKGSVRSGGMSLYVLNMLNLTPERFCTLLMPYFYGGWKDYWGGGLYCEGNLFMTVTGFILALFAWKVSDDPDRKVFGSMALLVAVLMVGTRTPLFGLFCKFFPLFDRFRGVSKLNIIFVLCLALLAALTHERILKDISVLNRLLKPLVVGGVLFLFLSVLFFLAPRVGEGKLFKQFIGHADSMTLNLLGTGLFFFVLVLFCMVVLRRPILKWGFLILVLVECLFFAANNLSSFDLRALRQKTSLIQETYDKDPGNYRVWMDSADYTLGASSGLDIWGEDPMMPLRYAEFAARTQNYDFERQVLKRSFFQRIVPVLGLLRLRYIFRDVGDHLTAERLHLKEVPCCFTVDQWKILKWDRILDVIVKPGFDATREALLESDPGIQEPRGRLEGNVKLKDISSDMIRVDARVSKPCLLIITDNYYRGWRIQTLPGSTQDSYRVLPAYGFLRAIPLVAGVHHFLLEYRPTAFVIGKWVSFFSWLFFLAFVLLHKTAWRQLNGCSKFQEVRNQR